MRVLIYIHSLESGGAERVSANLANHWVSKGWEVTIVTVASISTDFYELHPGVKRSALELTGDSRTFLTAARRNMNRIAALRRILKQTQPDVALAMMTNANVVLALASHGLRNLYTVGSEHIFPPQIPLDPIWEFLRRNIYGRLDAVAALTAECAGWIRAKSSARHVPVIPNAAGWPLPIQTPVVPPSRFCNPSRKLMLAVGRLAPQKNFGVLVDAFARLAPAHPKWDLAILGNGPDRDALTSQVRALGMEERIVLPGVVGNVATWYERADLYVMSSRFEGFPNTLAEAMAHGLPAVSFDCDTGPRDIIRNGVDGLLVRSEDMAGFIAALERLMSDEKLRMEFAARATQARERFSIERVSAMWEQLFQQGLARKKTVATAIPEFEQPRHERLP